MEYIMLLQRTCIVPPGDRNTHEIVNTTKNPIIFKELIIDGERKSLKKFVMTISGDEVPLMGGIINGKGDSPFFLPIVIYPGKSVFIELHNTSRKKIRSYSIQAVGWLCAPLL